MTFLPDCDILYKSFEENDKVHQRGVAQFGRALRSGRRGRKFESCHLDQLQKAELRKKLVIQPFFVTWGVLRKTGFFPKWQVKWQVGNGQLVLVVGIFRVGSVVQSRKKANGFEQKHEKCTAYRPRHYTSSLSESKAIPCKVTRRSLCGIALK